LGIGWNDSFNNYFALRNPDLQITSLEIGIKKENLLVRRLSIGVKKEVFQKKLVAQ